MNNLFNTRGCSSLETNSSLLGTHSLRFFELKSILSVSFLYEETKLKISWEVQKGVVYSSVLIYIVVYIDIHFGIQKYRIEVECKLLKDKMRLYTWKIHENIQSGPKNLSCIQQYT